MRSTERRAGMKPIDPNRIKAIVMDLDGTLLDEHNQITPQTARALIKLEKRGVHLILASGRSYPRLMDYAGQLEMKKYGGYLLEVDGLAIYELASGRRVKEKMMRPEEIQELISFLLKQNIETQAVYDDGLFVHFSPSMFERKKELRKELNLPDTYPWTAGPWSLLNDMRNGYSTQEYFHSLRGITRPVNKLQLMQEKDRIEPVYQALMDHFKDQYTIYRTTPSQLEVLPKGVSKGSALSKLMKEKGWDRDQMLVFGDGENDVSMFDAVDHSFAMSNAAPFIRKQASAIAGDHNQDGIVQALKENGFDL